ncbi:hypothetical protein LJC74_08700 [Eubacteriales bacterium OttesenSCG-928-A19]|nr:hypothetical protein [Eubacteriales bacterium OttesenSCG-928-A19]
MTNRHGQKMVAIGLTLCFAMGGAIGLAEDTAGTTALEAAMESMASAESMTIDAQFAIRQNGEDYMTGDMLYQYDSESRYSSSAITDADGETHEMEMSGSGDTCVLRSGDDFYSMSVDEMEKRRKDTEAPASEDADEAAESATGDYLRTVMEQLFGSVYDQMTISDTGLSLHLAGDEVPAILNLAVSMHSDLMEADLSTYATTSRPVVLHGTRGEQNMVEVEDVKTRPSLGSGLHIDRIDLDVAIEGETISGVQCSIVLVGQDADGAPLETELAAVIRILDVNTTEPATVDTDGVEMKPIEGARHNMRWRKR